MKYALITERSTVALEIAVNKGITNGFKPQGGMAVVQKMSKHTGGDVLYIQAMVK